ncbi:MAG: glycosyltransferase [Bacilli bacterium]
MKDTTENAQPTITLATPYISSQRGNSITAQRLKSGYESKGYTVEVLAYEENETYSPIVERLPNHIFHVLHAYRFANFIKKLSLPLPDQYIVTMTGTDHNSDLYDAIRRIDVINVLESASYVILFHRQAAEEVAREVPTLKNKIRVIPQGLILLEEHLQPRLSDQSKGLLKRKKADHLIFLLPAGLRPVKNIFYAIPLLKQLRLRYPEIQLWIVGPVLDRDTYEQLLEWTEKENWVQYGGEIPFHDMSAIYRESHILLNTSLSEGQASSLMEGMSYGMPVLASDIPGNISLIKSDETGLIFKSEIEFLQKAESLITSMTLRMRLGHAARGWVNRSHGLDREIADYVDLFQEMVE